MHDCFWDITVVETHNISIPGLLHGDNLPKVNIREQEQSLSENQQHENETEKCWLYPSRRPHEGS